MAATIVGKYRRVSTENYEEFLKELGVNFIMRKAANLTVPILEVTENNGLWKICTGSGNPPSCSVELEFVLGDEFQETTADGREVTSIINLTGTTMIQTQMSNSGGRNSTVIREFMGDTVTVILGVDGWPRSCIQVFERIQ